jgi:hypothetical protein
MNLHYPNHIVTVQSIASLPLPRPFSLASAFGFATAPVFHAAALLLSPILSLSLARAHYRSLFCFNFRFSRIGHGCFGLQFFIHITCCELP